MDDASADLILALQVQDLADPGHLAADRDGEGVEGDTLNDARIAQDLYREELRSNTATVSDFRFSEKVAVAAADEPPSLFASATPMFDQVLAESFGLLNIEANSAKEDMMSAFDHRSTGYRNCVICTDQFSARHLITAPCGDHYCKTCTGQLYDLALKDESLFPPRCCR